MSEKNINIPNHIGFILDGNRRWAKKRHMYSYFGHKKGYETLKKTIELCLKKGIKVLSVYVFSAENKNRAKKEVDYLMKLLRMAFVHDLKWLQEKDIKLKVSGWINDPWLPQQAKKDIINAQKKTINNRTAIVNFCFNYGGRLEIIHAIKQIIKKGIKEKDVNEEIVEQNLWTKGLPDLDFVIRTSEQRLSGFMLWQIAYSEIYFINRFWPDFSEKDLDKALKEYKKRKRRYGK